MSQSMPYRVRGWAQVGPIALVLALPSLAQSTKLSGPLAFDPGTLGGDVDRASFTPDGSRVLYLADQDQAGVRDLYSVPADISAPAVKLSASLTASSQGVSQYQVSADGARVVFSGFGGLYSVPVDGGAPSALLASSVSAFQITPDASSVVFLSGSAPYELRLVPIGGGAGLVLDSSVNGLGSLVLGPDGERAVYTNKACAGANCTQRVRSVRLDGSEAPLTLASVPLTVFELAVSADSSRAVYRTQLSGSFNDLFSAPLDGSSAAVQLDPTSALGGTQFAQLSPDGARVVYTGNPGGGEPQLFSVPTDGSASAVQLNPPLPQFGLILAFQITPDGARVVYRASQNVAQVYELFAVPIAGGSATLLSGALVAGGNVNDFQVSPDSVGVVFRADKNTDGVDELFGVPFGGAPFPLSGPLVAGGDVLDFAISADDLHVVYRADRGTDGVNELYRVAITGGASRRLSAPPVAGGGVAAGYVIAPDSARVVYLADQTIDQVVELFSTPILGGLAPVKLNGALDPGRPDGDVETYRLTPDGSAVVYTAAGETPDVFELYRAPVGGGAVVKLSGPFVAGGNMLSETSWELSADGAFVVYLATQEDPDVPELFSVPTDGSAPAHKLNGPVPVSGGQAGVRAFELTADGQRVVYRSQHNHSVAELFVTRVDGTGVPSLLSLPSQTVVNRDTPAEHHLSADGTRVVYRAGFDLFSAPLDGSRLATRLTPIFPPGTGLSPSFGAFAISPDSRWVVYMAGAALGRRFELYSVSIDGPGRWAGPTRLNAPLLSGGYVFDFQIDALSRRVVYLEDTLGRSELYSVPIRGAHNGRASTGPGRTGCIKLNPPLGIGQSVHSYPRFALSADGERALFLAGGAGAIPLFAARLDGREPARMLDSEVLDFRFTPDGASALYRARLEKLYRTPLDGSAPPQLLNVPRLSGTFVASTLTSFEIDASNLWVVYTSDERTAGVFELFARPLDLSTPPLVRNGPLVTNGDVAANGSGLGPAFRIAPGATHVVYLADQDEDTVVELYSSPLP